MHTDRPQRQQTTALMLCAVVVLLAGIGWLTRAQGPAPTPGIGAQRTPAATATGRTATDEPPLTRTAIAEHDADEGAAKEDGQTSVLVRVVDHDGRPLAGVDVRVAHPGPWGTFKDLRTGLTALDGTVSFAGHARDDVWAEVVADTLPLGHVAAGRVHGSLKQEPALTLTIECPRAGAVHGRFARAYGEPVAGATVFLQPIDHDSRSELRRTDRDGRFVVEHAHPGRWRIQIRDDDSRLHAGTSLPEPETIQVLPGGITPVELNCRREGQWLLGRVLDQHNRPVAGVLVTAGAPVGADADTPTNLASPGRAFVVTDGLGAYRLGPLPPERCAVQVGDRHGSSGVTRDRALFADWPLPFLAVPGDGKEHLTTVTVVDDVITWSIRPRLDAAFTDSAGIEVEALRAKVGWCRLFTPVEGLWTVRTARRGEPLLLLVSAGDREWRLRLAEPAGDVAEHELKLPPHR